MAHTDSAGLTLCLVLHANTFDSYTRVTQHAVQPLPFNCCDALCVFRL